MQIVHAQIVACPGYGYGAVQSPDETWQNPNTGNIHAFLGGRVFDVHPFRPDCQGYPIRWELNDADAKVANETIAFWKELGL